MCSVASVVSDSAILRTIARQAPLSMGFSRQEYWSGLPCPPPGDLPNAGIKPMSPALADGFFTTSATWEVTWIWLNVKWRDGNLKFGKQYLAPQSDSECPIFVKKWILRWRWGQERSPFHPMGLSLSLLPTWAFMQRSSVYWVPINAGICWFHCCGKPIWWHLSCFPGDSVVKNLPAVLEMQETWVRSLGQEDSWSRKWQPTPVFLPGGSHGWGALQATVHGVAKSQTWLSTAQ